MFDFQRDLFLKEWFSKAFDIPELGRAARGAISYPLLHLSYCAYVQSRQCSLTNCITLNADQTDDIWTFLHEPYRFEDTYRLIRAQILNPSTHRREHLTLLLIKKEKIIELQSIHTRVIFNFRLARPITRAAIEALKSTDLESWKVNFEDGQRSLNLGDLKGLRLADTPLSDMVGLDPFTAITLTLENVQDIPAIQARKFFCYLPFVKRLLLDLFSGTLTSEETGIRKKILQKVLKSALMQPADRGTQLIRLMLDKIRGPSEGDLEEKASESQSSHPFTKEDVDALKAFVAPFSDEDIEAVSTQLRNFPGRKYEDLSRLSEIEQYLSILKTFWTREQLTALFADVIAGLAVADPDHPTNPTVCRNLLESALDEFGPVPTTHIVEVLIARKTFNEKTQAMIRAAAKSIKLSAVIFDASLNYFSERAMNQSNVVLLPTWDLETFIQKLKEKLDEEAWKRCHFRLSIELIKRDRPDLLPDSYASHEVLVDLKKAMIAICSKPLSKTKEARTDCIYLLAALSAEDQSSLHSWFLQIDNTPTSQIGHEFSNEIKDKSETWKEREAFAKAVFNRLKITRIEEAAELSTERFIQLYRDATQVFWCSKPNNSEACQALTYLFLRMLIMGVDQFNEVCQQISTMQYELNASAEMDPDEVTRFKPFDPFKALNARLMAEFCTPILQHKSLNELLGLNQFMMSHAPEAYLNALARRVDEFSAAKRVAQQFDDFLSTNEFLFEKVDEESKTHQEFARIFSMMKASMEGSLAAISANAELDIFIKVFFCSQTLSEANQEFVLKAVLTLFGRNLPRYLNAKLMIKLCAALNSTALMAIVCQAMDRLAHWFNERFLERRNFARKAPMLCQTYITTALSTEARFTPGQFTEVFLNGWLHQEGDSQKEAAETVYQKFQQHAYSDLIPAGLLALIQKTQYFQEVINQKTSEPGYLVGQANPNLVYWLKCLLPEWKAQEAFLEAVFEEAEANRGEESGIVATLHRRLPEMKQKYNLLLLKDFLRQKATKNRTIAIHMVTTLCQLLYNTNIRKAMRALKEELGSDIESNPAFLQAKKVLFWHPQYPNLEIAEALHPAFQSTSPSDPLMFIDFSEPGSPKIRMATGSEERIQAVKAIATEIVFYPERFKRALEQLSMEEFYELEFFCRDKNIVEAQPCLREVYINHYILFLNKLQTACETGGDLERQTVIKMALEALNENRDASIMQLGSITGRCIRFVFKRGSGWAGRFGAQHKTNKQLELIEPEANERLMRSIIDKEKADSAKLKDPELGKKCFNRSDFFKELAEPGLRFQLRNGIWGQTRSDRSEEATLAAAVGESLVTAAMEESLREIAPPEERRPFQDAHELTAGAPARAASPALASAEAPAEESAVESKSEIPNEYRAP